jgi:hypothetical protein
MKPITSQFGLYLLVALSAQAEALPVDDWYQNHYAPLWKENPWDKVEEAAAYYADTIYLHPSDSTITAVDSRQWLAENLEGWRSDGWLGSAVAEYQRDQLNASTAMFKVKWRDWYAGGEEEFSCGWYLADIEGDDWVFTQYAEIDCAEHNL